MYPIHTLSFHLKAQVHMQGSRRDVRYSNVLEYKKKQKIKKIKKKAKKSKNPKIQKNQKIQKIAVSNTSVMFVMLTQRKPVRVSARPNKMAPTGAPVLGGKDYVQGT